MLIYRLSDSTLGFIINFLVTILFDEELDIDIDPGL